MRILIGVDESPHSDAAVEFVRKMTWPAGSKIIVVSAVRAAIPVYTEVYVPSNTDYGAITEIQTRTAEERVARCEERLRSTGLATEARVLDGDPREALVDAAKREDIDLVVLGSHGRTGLAKLLMGSVAAHVVAHASCNVLVIKRPNV
jgi:nucleotide-binding universal stress UspA family protein